MITRSYTVLPDGSCMHNYNSLMESAVLAALEAGRAILDVYHTAYTITLKDDRSPLTIADKNSHDVIASRLSATGLPLLSEEGKTVTYAERKDRKRFWMVDPLDGTKEFIKKNGEFTVNIALIEDNKTVMGIIYVPVSDTLYYGSAWLPGRVNHHASKTVAGSDPSGIFEKLMSHAVKLPLNRPARPYTVVASRSHLSPETENYIESLKKVHGEIAFVSRGSSLKLCLVAEGTADTYPRLAPTMEWDTAAGHAIAESCGCTFVNFHTGHAVTYNKENLLNPHFVVTRP